MATAPTTDIEPVEDWKDFVLDLLPPPGQWSDDAYLWLTDQTSRLVELNDGHLEILPVPTDLHQTILQALFLAFLQYLDPRGGKVLFAPLRLRLRKRKFREPDLLLVKDAKDPRRQNRFWTGADLVLEVLSEDRPERDLVEKLAEYAKAGIPEYWIVDPQTQTIAVFELNGDAYRPAGVFGRGAQAVSRVLPDFAVAVNQIFDAV